MAGCGFTARLTSGDQSDAGGDAGVDAPPPSPFVKFVSIETAPTKLRPGLYGLQVTAILRNELPAPISELAVSLAFSQDTTDRAGDFGWRDADAREGLMTSASRTVGAGEEAKFVFVVDVLPWAVAAPVAIQGVATFSDGATTLSASPAEVPLALEFAPLGTIVVNALADENDADTDICFREAIQRAAAQPGLDRIVFDPGVFPPGSPAVALLSDTLGEITVGQDVVIDGHGAGVILAADSSWENDQRYALRIASGDVVVSGITFRNFAYGYPNEGDLSANNCGGNIQLEGGAIRIDSGQLVLDGNRFEDPGVGERNCYAASVRIEGGSGHRILRNTWTDQVMDAIFVDAATREITGNLMNAGASLAKVDECIFIATQGGQPLWIANNLCVDQEYSAVIAGGTDAGALYVVNNTFVRNGRASLGAVRRSGNRAITLRNNIYLGNQPAGIILDTNGTGFDVAYEAYTGAPLFQGSSSGASVDTGSLANPGDLGLVDGSGTTGAELMPAAGSPMVGTGVDLLDTNGRAPGRYNGVGPERGAIERP